MKNNIIDSPKNISQCILNSKLGYTTQYTLLNSRKEKMTLFYLTHRSNKRFILKGLQFKEIDNQKIVTFILPYGNKFEEPYDSKYHNKIFYDVFNFKDIKINVFKNKFFKSDTVSCSKNDIYYADDIKRVLIKYLHKKFPTATVISEFKIGNTIVDVALFTPNKIYFYEIKSSQDSFTRLDKQLDDYLSIADYTFVVLDITKVKKYLKVGYSKKVGIIEFSDNIIRYLKKPIFVRRKVPLISLLWSAELKNSVKSLPLNSKFNSTLIEIYMFLVFKNYDDINKYVIYILFRRYQNYSNKLRSDLKDLKKGIISPFNNINLEEYFINVLDNRLTYTPKEFIKMSDTEFDKIFQKFPVLGDLLKIKKSSHYSCDKIDGTINTYQNSELYGFIRFCLKENNFSRSVYGVFEVKLFLIFLFKRRKLSKLIDKYK